MRDELQKELFEKYPVIFCRKTDPAYGGYYFSIDCGDGWYNLIDTLCRWLDNRHENKVASYEWRKKSGKLEEGEEPPVPVTAAQIKEKFGGLRFYVDGGDAEVHGAISFAESMSFSICDTCAKPGKTGGSSWVVTLCDECRLDYDKRRSYSGPCSVAPGQLKIGDSNG